MNITEAYSFLFFDSFFSALILTPRSELVIKLMTTFSGYNLCLVFILSIMGSVLGSLANWQIGKFFLFLHKTDFFQNNSKEIAKAEVKWHKFLVYILLLSWMNVIGNPFTVLAGFFKTNIKKFLLLVFVGKFFYYYIFVFHDLDLLQIFA
jgi:membrane protein YqaA with SNARE-associated domain